MLIPKALTTHSSAVERLAVDLCLRRIFHYRKLNEAPKANSVAKQHPGDPQSESGWVDTKWLLCKQPLIFLPQILTVIYSAVYQIFLEKFSPDSESEQVREMKLLKVKLKKFERACELWWVDISFN